MDRDASNNTGDEQIHPISQDTRAETPLAEDATMDNTSITPELEMDIDLPHFRRTEEVDNPPRKKIRFEIPDSEEASEVSSPVKHDGNDEQKGEEALELESLQMDQVAPEQNFEQEDNPNGKRKTARTEIPDSEEESKFSSPIKVGLGPSAFRDEVVQEAGRLEACEKGKVKEVETGGTTMMDLSAPEFAEGIFDTSRSRIEEVNVWVRTKKSGKGTMESVDNMKEIESTMADGTSPTSMTKNGGIAQQPSPVDNQDARSADTSTNPAGVEEINLEISHADANGGVILHEASQDKGNAGPMETFARMPLSSPTAHVKRIAAAAQGLLDEMSSTFSDINNTRDTPKISKNFTSIPDSDDEENDEPDAHVLGSIQFPALDTQQPAFLNQISRDEGTHETATFYSVSNVAIEEQRQRGKDMVTAASFTALKGANSQPVTIAASDIVPSTSMIAIESPSKKHVASQPIDSMEQSTQGTEFQQATEIPSSLTDVQAPPMPRTTSRTEESSQATDTSSSSPQPMGRGFLAAKKKESPPAAFIVPEAVQSKDVLMAELKAMKIASIQNRISALEAEIAAKRKKLEEVAKGLKQPAAQTVKTHIKLLHDYNDIKDVGQGLIGMIADNRGVRIGELYEEFGVGLKD